MADVVPMGMRMSMREEILQMGADEEARALKVKLGEEEEQSFQLFHPESAREKRHGSHPEGPDSSPRPATGGYANPSGHFDHIHGIWRR